LSKSTAKPATSKAAQSAKAGVKPAASKKRLSASKPSVKAAAKPSGKPVGKASSKPAAKPAAKPTAKAAPKSAAKGAKKAAPKGAVKSAVKSKARASAKLSKVSKPVKATKPAKAIGVAKPAAKVARKPAPKTPVGKVGARAVSKKPAAHSSRPPSGKPRNTVSSKSTNTAATKPSAKPSAKRSAAPAAKAATPTKAPVARTAPNTNRSKMVGHPTVPAPSQKASVKSIAAPATSASAPSQATASTATATTPRAGGRARLSRAEANSQPIPAAPIHPANRFADRFAPAKPSARHWPEPLLDIKPAGKPDPKLANAWKAKAGRDLTEPELLAMPAGEYMNDKQIEFFKSRLSALKEDLLSNAGETTEHLREDTTIVPDPADRATIEEEHALELRTRDRERKLLRKISQSLARIDSGEYGYCEETGEPIGLGRLLARPTATLSLEAQQRRELKQRMFGD